MTRSTEPSAEHQAGIRHLGKQTTVMMGGTAFTFLVGLPFQIYLAHAIGATGLGVIGIAEAAVLMLSGFLSLGLAQLPLRFIPEYRVTGSTRSIRLLLAGGLLALAISGTLGALFVSSLVAYLPDRLGMTDETRALLQTMRYLLPVSLLSFFLSQALRGFLLITVVVLSTSVLALLFKVILTVGFFATLGSSPENYALAIVLSQALAMLPMAWALWRQQRALPADTSGKPLDRHALVSYAVTAYASGLMGNLVGNMDRIVIGALLGSAAVGVLMVVRQLEQFPAVFHRAVLTVVSPIFARLHAGRQTQALEHQLHLSNDWIIRLASPLILVLLILPDHVLALYGANFARDGSALLVVMVLSIIVGLGTGPVGILLNMTGHHVVLLRISALSALSVFAGYFLLIPVFGLVGAGLAILLGNIISNGAGVWLVHQKLGIAWHDPRFRRWILPSLATSAVLVAARPVLSGLDGIGAQGVLLAGVTIVAYTIYFGVNLLSGLNEDDRVLVHAIKSRLAGLRGKKASET
ncbi:MAG: oligosaccharide flippase family protein [Martelella sp.]|uniref:oligosaccharide flippase family protein n=1 Tax=Martelella sp. TaxID=1969699 RepID=UPI003242A0F1